MDASTEGSRRSLLSAAQRRLFKAVQGWPAEHGLHPTLDELVAELGIPKSTIHGLRRQLRELKLVDFEDGKRRSTRATTNPAVLAAYGLGPPPSIDPSAGSPASPTTFSRSRRARLGGRRATQQLMDVSAVRDGTLQPLAARPSRRLPITGRIAAGPARMIDRDEGVLEVDGELVGPGRYALRVSGDSLVDLGVFDGDHVIVDTEQPVQVGDLVAALLADDKGEEDLATVKVFAFRNGRFWLEAGNPAFRPIPIETAIGLWRVTTVVRRV